MRGVNKDEDGFFITDHEGPRHQIENNPRLRRPWRRVDTQQDYFYSHQESQEVESQECQPFNREGIKVFYWR